VKRETDGEARGAGAPAGAAREDGYALVALVVMITVMSVMMAAAMPSWRYIMKNDREEELLFRAGEIADSIARYQRKNGNTLPISLEVLVKGRFLRKQYKDPMTKDGKWRFIRQGEAMAPPGVPAPGGEGGPRFPTSTTTTTTLSPFSQSGPQSGGFGGGQLGAIFGVASTSTEKSLRVFNGRSKYSEWIFMPPPAPRLVGRQLTPGVVGPGQMPPGAHPPPFNQSGQPFPGQPPGQPQFPGQQPYPQPSFAPPSTIPQ
jgi:type II secretory pathway pseudopilin PulG